MTTPNEDDVFDIGRARRERAAERAAERAGAAQTLPIRWDGEPIADLSAEFPLHVLAPLKRINADLTLLIRQFFDLAAAGNQANQAQAIALGLDILTANPELPNEVVDAVEEMGRRLFGADGFSRFMAKEPTPWDIAAVAKKIMSWYGVSLGESSPSSTPQTGGGTPNPTSDTGTESGSPTPTDPPATTPSSELPNSAV